MRYWCKQYETGDGYFGYRTGIGYDDDGLYYREGHGEEFGYGYFSEHFGFSPAMVVTGVKIEEVVLNAICV